MVTSEENIMRAENFPADNSAESVHLAPNQITLKGSSLAEILADVEKKAIAEFLKNSKSTTIAARRLGISRATLARKMKKYGLKRR